MISTLINFRTFNLILLSSLILYSCTTKLQSFKPTLTQQVNIDDNFTIEGKFKIKLNKDIQSGYFIISKKDNSVSLMIGKNYLLPERKFMYQVNDYLNLSKISNLQIEKNEERISDGKLEIRTLLQALLGNLPPKKGNNAPWHQDFAFYAHTRADLIHIQIYVDDSTIENGCLRIAPGSQKLGLFNHFKDGVYTGELQGDTSQYDEQEVILPMKAGGMVMWHTMTLHRSYPNKSTKQRRALVLAFKNPEARLMGGAWNTLAEVRPVGLMVRGQDPTGQLLSA